MGRQHRIDHLRLGWERLAAAGRLVAQADAPLALDVALSAHDAPEDALPAAPAPAQARSSAASTARPSASSAPLPHWAASAALRGPPAGFDVVADLQGEPLAGRAAPQASASAHVTPFAALPVSEVLARTVELDLRALSASAPATRLQGTLSLARIRPAEIEVDLRNLALAPGRPAARRPLR